MLTVDGPPWYDEYAGIMLREVNAVMQGETSSMGNVIFPECVAAAMQSEAEPSRMLPELLQDVIEVWEAVREVDRVTTSVTRSRGDTGPVMYHDVRNRKNSHGVRCFASVEACALERRTRRHEWWYTGMPAPPLNWEW